MQSGLVDYQLKTVTVWQIKLPSSFRAAWKAGINSPFMAMKTFVPWWSLDDSIVDIADIDPMAIPRLKSASEF